MCKEFEFSFNFRVRFRDNNICTYFVPVAFKEVFFSSVSGREYIYVGTFYVEYFGSFLEGVMFFCQFISIYDCATSQLNVFKRHR